ncbi:MAG TPA: DUF1761 domain-containing protein [Candidatus Dormibacteraeota bacterium]|nr:DUF1761 domain-containing protein [Candidatus Dormibacteraeota bacterium]
MPEADVNYVAVVVAAILNMAAGAAWYSRPAFGDAWAKAVGKKMEDMGGATTGYALTTIGSLIMAFVLAVFIDYTGAATFYQGAQTGLWAWLGFVLPTMGANAVFEEKGRKLFAINAGYPLLALILMGGLLAVW